MKCVQLAHICAALQMLNSGGAKVSNGANLHGVNQNRVCFTYHRFHFRIRSLGATLQLTRRHQRLETNVVRLAEKYTANTLHAQAVSHCMAGIKIPPRFETMSERIHHGDSSTSASQPSSTLLFLQFVRSLFFFFPPTACSFPLPAFLGCIAPSSTQSTQQGISPYHSIH